MYVTVPIWSYIPHVSFSEFEFHCRKETGHQYVWNVMNFEKTSQKFHKNLVVNFPKVRKGSIESSNGYG